MIVVLIIGVLLGIAVPQWRKARERSQKITCFQNLRKLDDAKDICAVANKLDEGDPVTEDMIFNEFMKDTELPVCPAGGTYTLGNVGEPVVCSLHGEYVPE